MMAADDLIRRQEAISCIRAEMKRTYTAARRQGFKQALEMIEHLPGAKEMTITLSAPVIKSPAPLHASWFYNAGWFFCDNCGGKSGTAGYTAFCPHCGARMDVNDEIE